MKDHGQMCGLAVALDYVGDRWTLLVVRELLVSPRTFSQIQNCLPGCSPNLLASRLKEMSKNRLIEQRSESSSPRELYHLTKLGWDLHEAVESLIRWGGNFIPQKKHLSEMRPHWLEIAVPALLRPKLKKGVNYKIQFIVEGHAFAVSAHHRDLDVIKNTTENADCTLNLPYQKLLALLSGMLSPKTLTTREIISTKFPNKSAAVKWLQNLLNPRHGFRARTKSNSERLRRSSRSG